MLGKFFNITVIILALIMCCSTLSYAKSQVKGDPELLWLSPVGDSDIEDNSYYRCLIARLVKPGRGQATTATQNKYDVLTNYVSNLYAQSLKISAYIEAEKTDTSSSGDVSNEIAILEKEIVQRMADISRRLNIINSFEAGIVMLDALDELDKLPEDTYSSFRALSGGRYEYVEDCEVLK